MYRTSPAGATGKRARTAQDATDSRPPPEAPKPEETTEDSKPSTKATTNASSPEKKGWISGTAGALDFRRSSATGKRARTAQDATDSKPPPEAPKPEETTEDSKPSTPPAPKPIAEWNYTSKVAELWHGGVLLQTKNFQQQNQKFGDNSRILGVFVFESCEIVAEVAGAWWWMTQTAGKAVGTTTPILRQQKKTQKVGKVAKPEKLPITKVPHMTNFFGSSNASRRSHHSFAKPVADIGITWLGNLACKLCWFSRLECVKRCCRRRRVCHGFANVLG